MTILQAIIIAIVEGITEFLPISSTAHMAITSAIMGIGDDAFTKLFEIVIQFGAILSVILLFWKKFFNFKDIRFYIKLIIAVIPALIFGALFKKHIDRMLGNPVFIAVVMLLGGILLLFVDKWFNQPVSRKPAVDGAPDPAASGDLSAMEVIDDESRISYRQSFMIGVYQTLSIVFPGLSRSAATIVGGMQQRLTRRLAAEFSFFLAVPTMLAATVKSLYDVYKESPEVLGGGNVNILLTGCAVAFVVALMAVRFFIGYLQKHGFRLFGFYRIIAGIVLLILIFTGYIHQ